MIVLGSNSCFLKHLACEVKFSAGILNFFFMKIGFDILCRLSPMETICIKYQILFSGQNKNLQNLQNLPIEW